MLVTQIRRVRRLVPELASVWVRKHNLEGGRPPCDWRDPADIDRLVSELVDDANELVWSAEDLDLNDEQADAVALLALVAGQDVEPGDGPGRWRIARRTAPDRVVSTNDAESRHTHKTDHAYRNDFKAHVATEPETGLVTDCDLTPGNTSDREAAPDLIDGDPDGTVVIGDSAYGTGEFRDHLERNAKTAVIKPPPLRPAVPAGFDLDDFEIDAEAATMTCPAGVTVDLTARAGPPSAHLQGLPAAQRLYQGTRRPHSRRRADGAMPMTARAPTLALAQRSPNRRSRGATDRPHNREAGESRQHPQCAVPGHAVMQSPLNRLAAVSNGPPHE